MRTAETFVVGAIVGAVVASLWRRQIETFVGEKTRGVRMKAAAGIRAVENKTGKVLNRGSEVLHRADAFFRDTQEQASEAVRAGQDVARPHTSSG
jgi:gas vesicle protein